MLKFLDCKIPLTLSLALLSGCEGYPLDGGTGFANMPGIGMGLPIGTYGSGGNWGHSTPPPVVDTLDGDPHGSGNSGGTAFKGNLNQDSERFFYHPSAGDRSSAYGLIYSP